MNIHEQQKQIICYRFDAFCKKAMGYAARNCYRDMKRRQQHEISLDYLMEEYKRFRRLALSISLSCYFVIRL